MGDAIRIDWRTQPEAKLADLLAALDDAGGVPLRTRDLGEAVGVFLTRGSRIHGAGWGTWCHAHGRTSSQNCSFVLRSLHRLEDLGMVVKLPHNQARSGARYVLCSGHEDARRRQRWACEALLRSTDSIDRQRRLRLLLDGLRGTT